MFFNSKTSTFKHVRKEKRNSFSSSSTSFCEAIKKYAHQRNIIDTCKLTSFFFFFFCCNDKSNINKVHIYLSYFQSRGKQSSRCFFNRISSIFVARFRSQNWIAFVIFLPMSASQEQLSLAEKNKIKKVESVFLSELKVTVFVSSVGYGDRKKHLFVEPFPFSHLAGPDIKRITAAWYSVLNWFMFLKSSTNWTREIFL